MRAATYIMADDLEGAEAGLADGHSSFHKVRYSSEKISNIRLMDLKGETELMLYAWSSWAKGWWRS